MLQIIPFYRPYLCYGTFGKGLYLSYLHREWCGVNGDFEKFFLLKRRLTVTIFWHVCSWYKALLTVFSFTKLMIN